MIPDSVLGQIQDRVDIVEIIAQYVPLKRAGRNFKANCPFHHEKTPSFMVSADKQIFHCFGCGVGGNVFTFLMKREKREFREVVELLAERTGVELPKDRGRVSDKFALFAKINQAALEFYHRTLKTHPGAESARVYLKNRGISPESIEKFQLGFAPDAWDALLNALKGQFSEEALESLGLIIRGKQERFYDRFRKRLLFPIQDAKGLCVAFGGRVLDQSLPKYLNSPESAAYSKGRHLYGLHEGKQAIREKDRVIVVEGYLDVITCHQAGISHVVASLGTALTADQARLIKRHTRNVYILYDADKAGELATLRGLELFLQEGMEVKIVRLPKGQDPDSLIRDFGAERFRRYLDDAKSLFDYRLALLKEQFDARSVEGKVKIANEMVALFSKVQNEILKSAWTKELAKQLALSEEALLAEIKKNVAKTIPYEKNVLPAEKAEVNPAEKLLFGLLLEDPHFAKKAKQCLTPGDFQNEKIRAMVTSVLETEETVSVSRLMAAHGEDPESVKLVSMACAEAEILVDKERTFEDCLLRIKESRIRQQREELRGRLLVAQDAGNKSQMTKILFDLNQLNKGIKKIYEKK